MSDLYAVIATTKLESCCAFYARALDAAVLERGEDFARLRLRGVELAFVRPGSMQSPWPAAAAPTRELSLSLPSDDLDRDYDELIRRGVAPLGPRREHASGQRSFSLTDPAGTMLHFIERRAQPLF